MFCESINKLFIATFKVCGSTSRNCNEAAKDLSLWLEVIGLIFYYYFSLMWLLLSSSFGITITSELLSICKSLELAN